MDTTVGTPYYTKFNRLSALEPRLAGLETHIKAIRDDGTTRSFCANHRWYGCAGCNVCEGGLKQEVTRLVGWEAQRPDLRTEAAYNVAYDHLYQLLPLCRNCICL